MNKDKENLLQCLRAFINQRPGLQFCNYGDVSAYRSEMRSITKAKHHAETLLNAVAWRDSITAEHIIAASKGAFSGRLTIERTDTGGFKIDYCTGQYFPTEYRNAVCAVLAACLWDYWRNNMPEPVTKQDGSAEKRPMLTRQLYDGLSAGDWLRRKARQEFGRGIASTWFR